MGVTDMKGGRKEKKKKKEENRSTRTHAARRALTRYLPAQAAVCLPAAARLTAAGRRRIIARRLGRWRASAGASATSAARQYLHVYLLFCTMYCGRTGRFMRYYTCTPLRAAGIIQRGER